MHFLLTDLLMSPQTSINQVRDLIFSLINIALFQDVAFHHPQRLQC